MNPNDPYNMYYRKRLQELTEGGQGKIFVYLFKFLIFNYPFRRHYESYQ